MPEITRRPDRAELAKRIERAEKLLQKGKAAEALEEYLQALRDDPENDMCGSWRRICVYRRTGRATPCNCWENCLSDR